MTLELSMLVPHVPSLCHEDQVPDFQKDMASAMKVVAKQVKEIKPDVIVLVPCHQPSTFFHYVDCTPIHKGILTAFEAPDLVKDVSYHYPGDEELANELVKAGEDAGLQVQGGQAVKRYPQMSEVRNRKFIHLAGQVYLLRHLLLTLN